MTIVVHGFINLEINLRLSEIPLYLRRCLALESTEISAATSKSSSSGPGLPVWMNYGSLINENPSFILLKLIQTGNPSRLRDWDLAASRTFFIMAAINLLAKGLNASQEKRERKSIIVRVSFDLKDK